MKWYCVDIYIHIFNNIIVKLHALYRNDVKYTNVGADTLVTITLGQASKRIRETRDYKLEPHLFLV